MRAPSIQAALQSCMSQVIPKSWQQAKRRADQQNRLRARDLERLRYRPPRTTLREAAFACMAEAYAKVSQDGTLPANARQIMYAARPLVLARTNGKCWEHSAYFTQILLPEFVTAYPDITADWDVILHLPKGSTRADADVRLADLVQAATQSAATGLPAVPPDTTLADYAECWLASRTELYPRTLASYRQLLKNYILPAFGSERVRTLSRGRVKRFLGGLARTEQHPSGLGKNSVRLVRACLSVLCEDAIDEGLLTTNPTRQRSSRRKQPGQQTRQERIKCVWAMDEAQLARFLAAARAHEARLAPLFLTMARTGLRPGEALEVQWGDLDLEARSFYVSRALSLGKAGPTKTGEPRIVHASAEVVTALTADRTACERETLRRGWPAVPPWIFYSMAGTPYDPANVVKAMKRALRKAELPNFRLL